jgi:hypothetical protein
MTLKAYAELHMLTCYCLARALFKMVRYNLRCLRESYPETQARIGLAMCGHDPFPDEGEPGPECVQARDTRRPVFYLDADYVNLITKH